MGIWGGVLFLAFNVFILMIIGWFIQNDGRLPEGSSSGLFAMRKTRDKVGRRSRPAYRRERFSNGWQASYHGTGPERQDTTDDA